MISYFSVERRKQSAYRIEASATTVPYKCIGHVIYVMQAAGVGKIGFVAEPPER